MGENQTLFTREEFLPTNPHPVIRALIIALADMEADSRGALKANVPPVSTELTERSIERAMLILNTLLTELDRRGHRVQDGAALVDGLSFTFHIRESDKIIHHAASAKKQADQDRTNEVVLRETPLIPPHTQKRSHKLSGRLVLEVRGGGTHHWDNRGQFRIEDNLEKIIATMRATAAEARIEKERLLQQQLQCLSETMATGRRACINELADAYERRLRLTALARHFDTVSASNPATVASLRSELSEMIRQIDEQCGFDAMAARASELEATYESRRRAILAEADRSEIFSNALLAPGTHNGKASKPAE
jgi:hypothetical protein